MRGSYGGRLRVEPHTRAGAELSENIAEALGSSTASTSSSAASPSATSTFPTSNSCLEPKGDAAIEDLTSVSLLRSGAQLEVTWTMVKNDTAPGAVGSFLNIASEDGSAAGQLGVKYLDGNQIAYFTFRDRNVNIPGDALRTATSVTAPFP